MLKTVPASDQFEEVSVQRSQPVKGYSAFMTVYANSGRHVLLCAPSMSCSVHQACRR